MSWGDILFGFRGRIGRKTFWAGGIIISLAALGFNALLSYLATGDALSADVWNRSADKITLWLPLWLAYFAFLAWPASALAIKRLNDRDRPSWIWFAYFALTLATTLIPASDAGGGTMSKLAVALVVVNLGLGVYYVVETGILRGTVGPNRHGPDPLPADYYGGDYNFWSLMFAPEGRIGRAKWWQGIVIVWLVIIVSSIAFALLTQPIFQQMQNFSDKLNDEAWLRSAEGQALTSQFALRAFLPIAAIFFSIYSLLALSIKRLQDRGLSSWVLFIVLLPFVAFFFAAAEAADDPQSAVNTLRIIALLCMASFIWGILQCGILKGEEGANRYGPDPHMRNNSQR